MSEAVVLDLALAHSAWNSTVAVHLGAGNVCLNWSKTQLPALVNLDEFSHADAFRAVDKERVLLNDSARTALERADGSWRFGASGAL